MENRENRIVQWSADTSQPQKSDTGKAFLAGSFVGSLVTVGIAAIYEASKDQQHQQQIQQAYWQGYQQGRGEMMQQLSQREAQLNHLGEVISQKTSELGKKEIEIARLNGIVENQASTLKWQQLQLTAKILSPNDDGDNGNGQLIN